MTAKQTFDEISTSAVHAGQDPKQWTHRQVVPPISMSSIYKFEEPNGPVVPGFMYGRYDNPTRSCLEQCLASLEGAGFCSAFSSGTAATAAIMNLLECGDEIVASQDLYGGTQHYLLNVAKRQGITSKLIPMCGEDQKPLTKALTKQTKMVWLETPTNPLLNCVDIQAVVNITKTYNKDIIIVVDNTFLTPVFQRPLDFGVDIVMHSCSKYLNGHDDVIMGCAMTRSEEIYKQLKQAQIALGAVPSPFDCYLVNRGLKTLPLRMKAHKANGTAVAQFLETHPSVEKVFCPTLPSHPDYELHKRQTTGMSGMVSFRIKGGAEEAGIFLKSLKIVAMAPSLGGVGSSAILPAPTSHRELTVEERHAMGITDNFIRLTIGIESVTDIINDLKQALEKAVPI